MLRDELPKIVTETVPGPKAKALIERRSERCVTDPEEIRKCLEKADHMVVAINDNGHIYTVPVNYGYEISDDKYTIYYHGAVEGRKAELAKTEPLVGFEMDINSEIIEGSSACNFSQRYMSIIGEGILTIVSGDDEKAHALSMIMKRITGRDDWKFGEEQLSHTNAYKIEVTELSCKARV